MTCSSFCSPKKTLISLCSPLQSCSFELKVLLVSLACFLVRRNLGRQNDFQSPKLHFNLTTTTTTTTTTTNTPHCTPLSRSFLFLLHSFFLLPFLPVPRLFQSQPRNNCFGIGKGMVSRPIAGDGPTVRRRLDWRCPVSSTSVIPLSCMRLSCRKQVCGWLTVSLYLKSPLVTQAP